MGINTISVMNWRIRYTVSLYVRDKALGWSEFTWKSAWVFSGDDVTEAGFLTKGNCLMAVTSTLNFMWMFKSKNMLFQNASNAEAVKSAIVRLSDHYGGPEFGVAEAIVAHAAEIGQSPQ